MSTKQKLTNLREKLYTLQNEFNALEKEHEENKAFQEKESEINWIEKIMNSNTVQKEMCIPDRLLLKTALNNLDFGDYKTYKKYLLRCIIEAVAEICNAEFKDDDKKDKYYIYYADNNITIGCYSNEYIYDDILFNSKESAIKAEKILTNLNSLNILEMYYKGV
jgi:hypothetical protein